MSGHVIVEYGYKYDPVPQPGTSDDHVMMWTDTAWDSWPENERGPWARTKINGHPVKVVKRTITYGPWEPAPEEPWQEWEAAEEQEEP